MRKLRRNAGIPRFKFWLAAFCHLLVAALLGSLSPQLIHSQEEEGYTLFAPFWTTERGFQASIHLSNTLPDDEVTVQPVLYMQDGAEIALPETTIPALGMVTVSINDALGGKGRGRGRPAQGGAALRYHARVEGALNATLTLLQPDDSLIFQFPFAMGYSGSASRTLEGAWWFFDQNTQGRLHLFNASDTQVTVNPTLYVGGLDYFPDSVLIPAHQSVELDLRRVLRDKGLRTAQHGGIRLTYSGEQTALFGIVLLYDGDRGFSHQIHLTGHDLLHQDTHPSFAQAGTVRTYSPAVMIGQPPTGMGFAPGIRMSPWLLLRNATDERITPDVRFTYMQGETPLEVSLPIGALFAQETSLVDLSRLVTEGLIPSAVSSGSVTVSYEGFPADLLVSLASVDQAGNFVATSRVNRSAVAALAGVRWRTDGDNNTVLTVQNIDSEDTNVQLTLRFGDGVAQYRLPPVRLGPGAIHAFALQQIQNQGVPDVDGRAWPAAAATGNLSLDIVDSSIRNILVTDIGVFNPVRGTCGPPEGGSLCEGFIDLILNPPDFSSTVGGTNQMVAKGIWYTGQQITVTSDTGFSSSASSIISVQNGGGSHGLATGMSVGSAGITGQAELPEYSYGIWFDIGCLYLLYEALSDGDVISVSVALSPPTVVPQAQTMVTVTVLPAQAGRSVNLSVQEVANSGGHQHLNRPLGTFAASSGTTDAQGKFTTTYTSSAFGGAETIKATSTANATGEASLNVQVAGLSLLADGANYDVVGATATHPVNHYGNATTNSNLPAIANAYAAAFPGSILLYNDMSLVRGGLFDIGPPFGPLWNTPHVEHRLGANCDVSKSNVPQDRWETLRTIFLNNNATFLEEADHWHLRF